MMCLIGSLDLERHLGRIFHQNSLVYLNQSQDTLASSGRLSKPQLMRNNLVSPFVLGPIFLNIKALIWAWDLSMFIMTCLTTLMKTMTLVPLAVLSMTYIFVCGTKDDIE